MECSICGYDGELVTAVSEKGLMRICKKCASESDFPIISRQGNINIPKGLSVYERLSKLSGYDKFRREQTPVQNQKDVELRKMVQQNVDSIKEKSRPRTDLIDHFHWIIMRARRSKKMTREQFAREIGESEAMIRAVEDGFIPENKSELVSKIEAALGIIIRKNPSGFPYTDTPAKRSFGEEFTAARKEIYRNSGAEKSRISFDSASLKKMTIKDLKGLGQKTKRGDEFFDEEEQKKPLDEMQLSDDEIDDIIFGRAG